MSSRIKGNQGFSLIELIVVVGIIGILAAVAISNYLTYQAKTRQAEVKAVLGGAFISATIAALNQNGTYVITDISQLGFSPSGTPKYSYWYDVSGTPTAIPGSSTDTSPCNVTIAPSGVAASATGFTMGARGNIDNDPACDEWLINDRKILTNTSDDVMN